MLYYERFSTATRVPKILGRRQVVRQRVLIPIFVGSNPSAPAVKKAKFNKFNVHHVQDNFANVMINFQVPFFFNFNLNLFI